MYNYFQIGGPKSLWTPWLYPCWSFVNVKKNLQHLTLIMRCYSSQNFAPSSLQPWS